MSSQASSMRSWASSCWPHRPGSISTGEVAQVDAEGVGQRVGRIGGDHDGAVAGVGAAQCGGRRRGGLADPALAGEQQDAHAQAIDVVA